MPGHFTYYSNINDLSFKPAEGEEITVEEASAVARIMQANATAKLASEIERIADYIDAHGFTDRFYPTDDD